MTTARADQLFDGYAGNTSLIHVHVDGVSGEASMMQLPFGAHCLNWVVGHVVWRRNSARSTLGAESLWGAEPGVDKLVMARSP